MWRSLFISIYCIFFLVEFSDVEKSSDTPDENRTPSASVSPESTLTSTPIHKNSTIAIENFCPSRPQSLQVGKVIVSGSIDKPPANNIMCDKEQQTPQDPSPPFIIPPPLFSQEIFESSSELDFKVILCKGLYDVLKKIPVV